MTPEQLLREKLRKIEALFAGAATEGERVAAGAAADRRMGLHRRFESVERHWLSGHNPFYPRVCKGRSSSLLRAYAGHFESGLSWAANNPADVRSPALSGRIQYRSQQAILDVGFPAISGRGDGPFI